MNTPYTYEDYLKDLLLVSRDAPGAGSALARIKHYEAGRDPYNLPPKDDKFEKFISIVGWCVAIFIASIIISIITGW